MQNAAKTPVPPPALLAPELPMLTLQKPLLPLQDGLRSHHQPFGAPVIARLAVVVAIFAKY